MPHSPWLHRADLAGAVRHRRVRPRRPRPGRFEPVCFLQGFARGLAFLGDPAVIGISRPRETRTFDGLPVNERLARERATPLCHLAASTLATGDSEHRPVIEGVVEEVYDVAAIPGVICPMAIDFRSDEIRFW